MRKEIGIAKSSNENGKKRKYSLDENCFSELNEKSAYWIGFLYWDWSCTNENKIRCTLQEQDREHLFKFRDFIKSNDRPIKTILHNILDKVYSYAHIEFRSWKIHNILKQYELTIRKENRHRLNIALLQPEIRRHFIRWVFDADWYVWKEKTWLLRSEITGYMSLLKDIKNILVLDWIIWDTKNIVKNWNIFRLRFSKQDTKKLLQYLYGNKPFYYLKRKYMWLETTLND